MPTKCAVKREKGEESGHRERKRSDLCPQSVLPGRIEERKVGIGSEKVAIYAHKVCC